MALHMHLRLLFFAALIFSTSLVSAGGVAQTMFAINNLCSSMTSLLPVAGMLMIMVGAVVYAAGQVMGAETRARANVWATTCLTGALVAMLIAAISPSVLTTIYGKNVGCYQCTSLVPSSGCPAGQISVLYVQASGTCNLDCGGKCGSWFCYNPGDCTVCIDT